MWVCPACFETKHPALTPRKIPTGEPRPLLHARPPVRLVVDVDAIDITNWWPSTSGGQNPGIPAVASALAAETGAGLESEDGTDLELE